MSVFAENWQEYEAVEEDSEGIDLRATLPDGSYIYDELPEDSEVIWLGRQPYVKLDKWQAAMCRNLGDDLMACWGVFWCRAEVTEFPSWLRPELEGSYLFIDYLA